MKKYITIEEYFKTQSIPKEKNNNRKIFRNILAILCFGIILFSIYTIFNWNLDNSKIRQINEKIEKNVNLNVNKEDGILVNPPDNKNSNYYYYASLPFYEADFSSLLSMNDDTVAFLKVKNTLINYPVVQTDNNDFYLKHSYDKKENKAGWVFMDYRNNANDLNENTIIYGHGRYDGTMFGSLKNVLLTDWQDNLDNYVIFLSTIKEKMIFQIFSIYTVNRESYYITPNFSSNQEKQQWIDTMKKRNLAPIETEVDVNDKFLTLSTCQNNQGGRIVVHAKLIKKTIN